jgi:hypothetical protein
VLGEHTAEVLAGWLGRGERAIRDLRRFATAGDSASQAASRSPSTSLMDAGRRDGIDGSVRTAYP